jgi:hypothetical protein
LNSSVVWSTKQSRISIAAGWLLDIVIALEFSAEVM